MGPATSLEASNKWCASTTLNSHVSVSGKLEWEYLAWATRQIL